MSSASQLVTVDSQVLFSPYKRPLSLRDQIFASLSKVGSVSLTTTIASRTNCCGPTYRPTLGLRYHATVESGTFVDPTRGQRPSSPQNSVSDDVCIHLFTDISDARLGLGCVFVALTATFMRPVTGRLHCLSGCTQTRARQGCHPDRCPTRMDQKTYLGVQQQGRRCMALSSRHGNPRIQMTPIWSPHAALPSGKEVRSLFAFSSDFAFIFLQRICFARCVLQEMRCRDVLWQQRIRDSLWRC